VDGYSVAVHLRATEAMSL